LPRPSCIVPLIWILMRFLMFNAALPSESYPLSYTTLFRSQGVGDVGIEGDLAAHGLLDHAGQLGAALDAAEGGAAPDPAGDQLRSEEHTSELQSRENLVCRLLLEKKKQRLD